MGIYFYGSSFFYVEFIIKGIRINNKVTLEVMMRNALQVYDLFYNRFLE